MPVEPVRARRAPLRLVTSVGQRRRAERSSVPETRVQRSLTGGAAWLLSANILYAAVQWGALVALAKLGTPVTLGYFGLALAVATPATMIAGFGLRAMQATDVLRRYAFADYLQLRLVGNLMAASIVAVTIAVTAIEPEAVAVLIPIAWAKLAEATSETCYGLAQRHHRIRLVALSKVVRGALGLTGLVIVLAAGGSLATGAWVMAGLWTAFLLLVDLRNARRLEPAWRRPEPRTIVKLASEGVALSGVDGALALSQSIPRYLLQAVHGAAAVGYFTALAAIAPALDQLAGSIGHAAAPRLGASAAEDRRAYRHLVARLFGIGGLIGVALTIGAVVFGRPFLHIAYAPDYGAYRTAFVFVTMGAGFALINSLSYFAMVAVRRPGLLLVLQCVGTVVTAVAAAMLIPRFSVSGAAAAVCLGRGIVCLATAALLLGSSGESSR